MIFRRIPIVPPSRAPLTPEGAFLRAGFPSRGLRGERRVNKILERGRLILSIILAFILLSSCGGSGSRQEGESSDGEQEMDQRTRIRLRQYMVHGKALYQTYCANCHQQNGEGLAQLYPPLSGSDYLLSDLPRTACLIKNGMKEPVVVNGVTYAQTMPAFERLTPIEIAEIITYITNSWENEAGLTSTRDVARWLDGCKEADF